jgi:hypothetical protein
LNRLTDYSTSATSCSVAGSKHIHCDEIGNVIYKSDVGSYPIDAAAVGMWATRGSGQSFARIIQAKGTMTDRPSCCRAVRA